MDIKTVRVSNEKTDKETEELLIRIENIFFERVAKKKTIIKEDNSKTEKKFFVAFIIAFIFCLIFKVNFNVFSISEQTYQQVIETSISFFTVLFIIFIIVGVISSLKNPYEKAHKDYYKLKQELKKENIKITDEDCFFCYFFRFYKIRYSTDREVYPIVLTRKASEYYKKYTAENMDLLTIWNSVNIFPNENNFFF